MKFVEEIGQAWRWFSMQAMVLSIAIQGAWIYVPPDLQATLPHGFVRGLTIALLVAGAIGRLVQQKPKV